MQAPAKLIVLGIALLLASLAVVYRSSAPDHEPRVDTDSARSESEVAPQLEPFDIEEPLFVMTSGERRILVHVVEQTLFWVDDYSHVSSSR